MKKLLNGIMFCMFVIGLSIIASCSNAASSSGESYVPPEELKAGKRPVNLRGSETLPVFTSANVDHLYLSASSAGKQVYFILFDLDNGTNFQWYKGKDGNWEKMGESSKQYSKKIEVESGVTYYMCEAKSENGTSIAYSKVFTVECGTEKTNKIGYIAYKNGDKTEAHADYDPNYGTPIGIVFDVNSKGEPTKILNLNQKGSLVWCLKEVQGDHKNFAKGVEKPLSYIDGSVNWSLICKYVTDCNVSGNYPAFEYCNGLSQGDKKWYLPAKDELVAVSYNLNAINAAISKLPEETATTLPSGRSDWLLSSSQYADTDSSSWIVYLNDGKQFEVSKYGESMVRAVAAF